MKNAADMPFKTIKKWPKRASRALLLAIRRRLYEEVLVLGDSHARVFHHKPLQRKFRRHFFHIFNIPGTTASGLSNPQSVTQAYPTFQKALSKTTARWVIVTMGEVDTGFVIWYRAKKYNESVEAMLERAIGTYRDFIQELIDRGYKVICMSTPLPTISDGVAWGEVAQARREVAATQIERTELTLEFNRRMAAFCAERGARFIDLDPESIGPDHVVRPDLLNPDPTDHHYHRPAHARILLPHLQRILEHP